MTAADWENPTTDAVFYTTGEQNKKATLNIPVPHEPLFGKF